MKVFICLSCAMPVVSYTAASAYDMAQNSDWTDNKIDLDAINAILNFWFYLSLCL